MKKAHPLTRRVPVGLIAGLAVAGATLAWPVAVVLGALGRRRRETRSRHCR